MGPACRACLNARALTARFISEKSHHTTKCAPVPLHAISKCFECTRVRFAVQPSEWVGILFSVGFNVEKQDQVAAIQAIPLATEM